MLTFHISKFNIFQIPIAARKEVTEEEEEEEIISAEPEIPHDEGEQYHHHVANFLELSSYLAVLLFTKEQHIRIQIIPFHYGSTPKSSIPTVFLTSASS